VGTLTDNGWVVNIASGLAGAAIMWLCRHCFKWVRERVGPLSGSYLSLTQMDQEPRLLVEIIRLRHAGDELKGLIRAKAYLLLGEGGKVVDAEVADGLFRFVGRLHDRQMVLSYWSTRGASQNSGSMTMLLSPDGETLSGIWSGTDRKGHIIQGRSVWFNTHSAFSALLRSSTESIADIAEQYLDIVENPWRSSRTSANVSRAKLLAYHAGHDLTRQRMK